MKKILIAVDDSPIAEKIVLAGSELAKQMHAEVALLSVVDTAMLMTEDGLTTVEMADIVKNNYKQSQQLLTEKIFPDHKIWLFVEEGKPYESILKVAKEWDADLIVLGTHGRTGLPHLLMGSVAEKVIRHSVKPLLVIPSRS